MTLFDDYELDELPAYAAHHHLKCSWDARAKLYAGVEIPEAEAIVGIDWGTGPVTAISAFENHEKRFAGEDRNRLREMKDGAIVRAYYGKKSNQSSNHTFEILDDYCVLGIVPPGTSIHTIPVEPGTSKDDNESADQKDLKTTFVKGFPMVGVKEISRENAPSGLFSAQRGRSIWDADGNDEMPDLREVYRSRL